MRYFLLIDQTTEACSGLSREDADVILSVGGAED
jgi:hypothetical protein